MPLQFSETWDSGEGTLGASGNGRLSVMVWGDPVADNADDIFTAVKFGISLMPSVDTFGRVFSDFDYNRQGVGRWVVSANYKNIESNRQTNDASFSFSTGGGTQHITHSRATSTFVPGSPPTGYEKFDAQGAINVSGSGANQTIGGVDIHVAAFSFKTSFFIDPKNMTEDYIEQLRTCTGSVNSDEVHINVDGVQMTFQSGELLLLGADGSKRAGFGDWELGLSWAGNKNVTGLVIGSGQWKISDIEKRGWDYLWVYSKPDAKGKHIAPTPHTVFVEQVYPYNALSGLLPTAVFGLSNTPAWTFVESTGAGFTG